MVSTFVRRNAEACNRSISRIEVDGFPPPIPVALRSIFPVAAAGRPADSDGPRRSARNPSSDRWVSYTPCPAVDFNGANFLYFASFQMFVDRVEWEWFRDQHLTMGTTKRKMQFYGNINPGESIRLTLEASSETVDALHHWISVLRSSDDRKIAEIETLKELQDSGDKPKSRNLVLKRS